MVSHSNIPTPPPKDFNQSFTSLSLSATPSMRIHCTYSIHEASLQSSPIFSATFNTHPMSLIIDVELERILPRCLGPAIVKIRLGTGLDQSEDQDQFTYTVINSRFAGGELLYGVMINYCRNGT